MKIKYVNQPKKADGKYGNIKMDNGDTYFVNVGNLNKYAVGMDITPPATPTKWGDNVVQVIPPHYDPTAANQNATQPPATPSAPPPTSAPPSGHNSARMSNADGKDVMITAIALMKSFIEGGNYGLTDLPALEAACIPAAKRIVTASQ